jgi:uncharacterized protein YdeI (YjbR/CyaY-like superfamily)
MALEQNKMTQEELWGPELAKLQELLAKTELVETRKWGMPTYTLNKKNVVGIGCFKNFIALWFHQGAFLSDPLKVLTSAQSGKTKGMRHWRFTSLSEMDDEKILMYLLEAVENEKQGKRIKVEPKTKNATAMPVELQTALGKSPEALDKFASMSPSHQEEYRAYVVEAKREETRIRRSEKCLNLILQGSGLNDKYRK